jgi:D-alanine-D-alanine ligase
MPKFTVALLYNLKQNAPHRDDEPWDAWNELDSEKTIANIERALRAGGHEVIGMEGDARLPEKLAHYHVDIAFNTCEGHFGVSREAQVPAILDALRIPYTGSGVMTLCVALDKPMAKRILMHYGLPTPRFQTFVTGDERLDAQLKFPLFVKPSREGSGIGINAQSVCRNARALRAQVQWCIQTYRQPALVEEYIEGREFTLGMLGNLPWAIPPRADGKPPQPIAALKNAKPKQIKTKVPETLRVFPPLEVDLSPCPPDQAGLYTSVIKSQMYDVPKYPCPAPISKRLWAQMEKLAAGAFAALECTDFARVDFRLRQDTGEPTILEINPLAGLQEGISDIVMAGEADGVSFAALINGILDAALQRYGMI